MLGVSLGGQTIVLIQMAKENKKFVVPHNYKPVKTIMNLRRFVFAFCLLTHVVSAQELVSDRPVMQAYPLETRPTLDGEVLKDLAWDGLVPATGFEQVQPFEGMPASQKTEVFIGFTDNDLYIGLVAYDDSPDDIIVNDASRDSDLNDGDSFRVIIDGLLDRQNGFVFGTNPLGEEYDAQVVKEGISGAFGTNGFNLNWDASWSVKAQISDIGWSAEMRIPFKTLRYRKSETQTWGINFQRNIRRNNNEIVYWAPLDRQRDLNRLSDAGFITGISPPSQINLKFTPYALAKGQRGGELDGTQTDTEFGFDIKYSITPSLTLDVTYNTDFAQVEADEQRVNLDRFNLFFPEKRPFFLENAGQFTVGNNSEVELFFSRRIGISDDGDQIPIDGGVRVSGKVGNNTNVGFLYMSSEAVDGIAPGNQFTVARVNQEFGIRSAIGAIFVERNGDGSYLLPAPGDKNRTYGVDGQLGIGENTIIQAWVAKTDTPGLDGNDTAFSLKADYDSEKWFSTIEYTQVDTNFNPEVGFLNREDYRKVRAFMLRRIRPQDKWGLFEIRPHIAYTGFWDFDGFQETGVLHNDVHWEWLNGYEFHTAYDFIVDGIKEPFEIIDGVNIEPGTYRGGQVVLNFNSNESAALSFRMRANFGDKFGGDRIGLRPSIEYRVGKKFTTNLSVNHTDFDLPVPGGDFSVTLTRLRLSYSFTPKIRLQALLQYNDDENVFSSNVRFSWLRTANTGLYLVYNEIDERAPGAPSKGREIILKYSYMFDVFR